MSEVKVNKITPRTDCGTTQLGDSGDTVTVTGDLRSNSLKASDGGVIISQSGTTITVGASGDTVSLASGASQTGFGRTGTVDWQTGSIKTSDFTAVDGQGFFVDTNGGAVIATLPTGSAGSIVSIQDYRNTFDTNNCTVQTAGSQKINGGTGGGKVILSTEGEGITLVYIDSTVGWRSIQDNVFADASGSFITATGGTITNCGSCRIHTFTSPGTFCVSAISGTPANNQVSYIVVAGGGGGGVGDFAPSVTSRAGGGGGAGGFREDKSPVTPYTASPLDGAGNISVTATGFPITVGGGGAAGVFSPAIDSGSSGSNSVFSTITSTGGGGGESAHKASAPGGGKTGGSGGGGSAGGVNANGQGGNGNTPPVSPAQGTNGGGAGNTGPNNGASGGGGASAAGETYTSPFGNDGGAGGAGVASSISGSSVTRSGGGGGGGSQPTGTGGAGGSGGGGAGGKASPVAGGVAGTANTGGGGGAGGGFGGSNHCAGAGGSGIVIIRYKNG